MNKIKKALIVTTVSGFVPQFEMNNVKILQNMGYEVHYASNFGNPSYGNDNHRLGGTGIICHQIDLVRSPFRVYSNIKAYCQLRVLLKSEEFRLVHCHTPMGGILGRLASRQNRKNGCNVLYTAHGFHFYKGAPIMNWIIYYPIECIMMHLTDVLVTITIEDYQRALTLQNSKGPKIIHIPGVGIDTNKYSTELCEKQEKKMEYGWLNKTVITSIGELNKNKNHKIILEALEILKETSFIYLICGQGSYQQKLKNEIKKAGLEEQVLLLGYKENIKDILLQTDVFVFPSFREGLSVALQEAMASGLPAIVSDIRGNNELIDQGVGGWRISPYSSRKWAETLVQIDTERMASMGEYNRRKMKDYDISKVSKHMKKIYSEI